LILSIIMLPICLHVLLGLARNSLLGFPAIWIHLVSVASFHIVSSLATAILRTLQFCS
jgi:hypothetical protein